MSGVTAPTKQGGAIGILWVLILIAVTNIAIVFITWCLLPSTNGFAMFVAWVLNVIVTLVAAVLTEKRLKGGGMLIVPIAGYILFSLVYGIMGGRIPKVFRIRETPTISVKEADRYPGHDVYHFSDGRVNTRYASLRRMGGRPRRYYYHAAP